MHRGDEARARAPVRPPSRPTRRVRERRRARHPSRIAPAEPVAIDLRAELRRARRGCLAPAHGGGGRERLRRVRGRSQPIASP
ncbi:hypothetical protein MTP99_015589 [Tenebrio molitor]|nr:hypothetical protein MTP99_015589 [Tenebrio molitor]